MLVDTRLVSEGVRANDGFVRLHGHARVGAHHLAGAHNLSAVYIGGQIKEVFACLYGHHHLFQ